MQLVFFTRLLIASCCFLHILPSLPDIKNHNPPEICDNALDDDNDGLIDINDPDCACEVIEPISLIPNPSFEDTNCCPNNRSQLDCADVWIQASEPTTDLIHTCDWLGWEDFPPPMPFPDGEGIMGFRDGRVRNNNSNDNGVPETNWKEYAGACLLSPLVPGTTYRFEFDVGFVSSIKSPPINITFFGTSDCKNLPFGVGDDTFGCPTNGPGWVNLGSTFLSGGSGNKWVKGSIEVTPTEAITAIAIGPDCPGVQTQVSIYYFFDNLLLTDLKAFELRIAEVEHPCSDNFSLKIANNTALSYQWYKDGIALVGETSSQLKGMHGAGDYQVKIDDGMDCRLSGNFTHTVPIFSESISKTICEEDVYIFGKNQLNQSGIYVDTLKTTENCPNVVTLNLKVLGALADTVKAKFFVGESYSVGKFKFKRAGNHLVTLPSKIGCDSLVFLELDYFKVYIPNVFSPNFDGVNDLFSVQSEQGLVESSELTIFNRWGVQVFQGTNWDGKYNGTTVDPGVFIYKANLLMNDGIERQLSGSVTLIK